MIKEPADARFKYTIKRIADWEKLWVIGDGNVFATFSDDENNIVFPIWPFEELAQLCCIEEYSQYRPEVMSLDDFLNEFIPDFEKSNYKLSLLPLSTGKGMAIDISMFKEALNIELEKYE
ncbi:Protein of unknown function [Chitinophaga sp. CF118]|nr:Protein of unknown function [Chitinophaga sp. CF118]